MRRQIIILLTLLLMTLPVVAQDWPDSVAGDQVEYMEAFETQMHLYEFHDMNPWSMPDPTGQYFYFGTLAFGNDGSGNVAIIDLDSRAGRMCKEPPWGMPNPSLICYYYSQRRISFFGYVLPWNEAAQAYISYNDAYWGTSVVVLTYDADNNTATLALGAMTLVGDEYEWDLTRTIYRHLIEERTASPFLIRRGAQRRGPS